MSGLWTQELTKAVQKAFLAVAKPGLFETHADSQVCRPCRVGSFMMSGVSQTPDQHLNMDSSHNNNRG